MMSYIDISNFRVLTSGAGQFSGRSKWMPRCMPLQLKMFSILGCFWKNLAKLFVDPLRVSVPSYRESWIGLCDYFIHSCILYVFTLTCRCATSRYP